MDRQATKLPSNYALLRTLIDQMPCGKHVSAAELHRMARAKRPGLGLATVFRGLARLIEHGDIAKIDTPAGAVYERASAPHAHLQCRECEKTYDVEFAIPERTKAKIAERDGTSIDDATIVFHGLCAECAKLHR